MIFNQSIVGLFTLQRDLGTAFPETRNDHQVRHTPRQSLHTYRQAFRIMMSLHSGQLIVNHITNHRLGALTIQI